MQYKTWVALGTWMTLAGCMGPAGVSNLSGGSSSAVGNNDAGPSETGSVTSISGIAPSGGDANTSDAVPATSTSPNDVVPSSPPSSTPTTTQPQKRTARLWSLSANQELDPARYAPSLPRYALWDDDQGGTSLPPVTGGNIVFLLTDDASRCGSGTLMLASRQSSDWLLEGKVSGQGQALATLDAIEYGEADANRTCSLTGDKRGGSKRGSSIRTSAFRSLCFLIDLSSFDGPLLPPTSQVCLDLSEATHCALAPYLLSDAATARLPCRP